MYEFITSEIVSISPKDATAILRYNTYHGQRGIKKQHLEDLADRMKKGLFTTGSICLATTGTDGKTGYVLMDGQHTLSAVVKSGATINAVLERILCKTPKDLALLYQQKDGGVARSLKDYVIAEKDALNIKWPTQITTLIVSALSIINNYNGKLKTRKIELLEQYIPDGDFIVKILGEKNTIANAHLWRAPVIGSMILTYRSDSLASETFWRKVKSGEMLMSDDPQYVLRAFLLSHNRTNHTFIKPTATQHEFIYKCLYAWNAFKSGKKVKMIKYTPSYKIPTVM